ncbi:hypothetical protein [Planosporangium mesophilum]|uniref:hypothetical protein n=1 Tax=Planosporangium mesophilum TaxID=689768 RepID=UPI00143B8F65|nr:hypothetical protein [Planosporangium mesophilum]NJC84016.1 hypothetical protein [Planosporangium mesophilum]
MSYPSREDDGWILAKPQWTRFATPVGVAIAPRSIVRCGPNEMPPERDLVTLWWPGSA